MSSEPVRWVLPERRSKMEALLSKSIDCSLPDNTIRLLLKGLALGLLAREEEATVSDRSLVIVVCL